MRAVGVSTALVLLHLPRHNSSIKTICAQVLGLFESYWRIYSLALMIVEEIICEEFLRHCESCWGNYSFSAVSFTLAQHLNRKNNLCTGPGA